MWISVGAEQRKRIGISLCDVAGIVDVQMVFAGKSGVELRRPARVPQHLVEIDDSVEFAAVPYPVIDRLARAFSFRCIEGEVEPSARECRPLEWRDRQRCSTA